ncbi:hypothetical protein [Actinospica sp.]|uniref:hypothetical protein n=1 Tax=Actinospica sp. TaxID=1872142 RepID=UPI002BC17B43|nr:hypothetical protein [Actinospica sp.]HWG25700.1 hypothetical protein [Actinospica sp.]
MPRQPVTIAGVNGHASISRHSAGEAADSAALRRAGTGRASRYRWTVACSSSRSAPTGASSTCFDGFWSRPCSSRT